MFFLSTLTLYKIVHLTCNFTFDSEESKANLELKNGFKLVSTVSEVPHKLIELSWKTRKNPVRIPYKVRISKCSFTEIKRKFRPPIALKKKSSSVNLTAVLKLFDSKRKKGFLWTRHINNYVHVKYPVSDICIVFEEQTYSREYINLKVHKYKHVPCCVLHSSLIFRQL